MTADGPDGLPDLPGTIAGRLGVTIDLAGCRLACTLPVRPYFVDNSGFVRLELLPRVVVIAAGRENARAGASRSWAPNSAA